jgi:hypothetical protein
MWPHLKLLHWLTQGILITMISLPVLVKASAHSLNIEVRPLIAALTNDACSGQFETHLLDHQTSVPGGDQVRMFEANGSGLAINDLDNDGDLDIVLANHAGANTILWNDGKINFTTDRMSHGESRAVSIVDVDGDDWQDIVFTRINGAPTYWRNLGHQQFERTFLPLISEPLYTINWADFDQDGDLDLVGATYDAGLLADFGPGFLMSGKGGVYYYENRNGSFYPQRLAAEAQGLAAIVLDLNHDGYLDFMIGNDFALPDQAWVWNVSGWQKTLPMSHITYSTMSFDTGDINNDGLPELFATDMKPYDHTPSVQSAWRPVLSSLLNDPRPADDPQVMANVLHTTNSVQSTFYNIAADQGVDATGWSWSGKFGDLNQDGFLDLYVVNGMIEQSIFAHLPHHELVEANQVFVNDYGKKFIPRPAWRLDSTASGRGMSMADLDGDGDLDIVINNLRAPAQLFENKLCTGTSLLIDLKQPGTANTSAVGAEVILDSDQGRYYRQVKAISGYLSGDPARLHFGLPEQALINSLSILWPDGQSDTITGISPSTHVIITRSTR